MQIKTTNSEGRFAFNVPVGDYTLSTEPVNDSCSLCTSSFDLTINEEDSAQEQDFLADPTEDCAHLSLDFSTPFLRRCFDNYYSVRLRNTGPALSETNTLTIELDLSTLEMLSASHPFRHQAVNGPTLEVTFDDILLPDSTVNEPASHGYFKFKIKPLPAYDYGTVILNQAAIYFDFNEPIFTNIALLGIQPPGRKTYGASPTYSQIPLPMNSSWICPRTLEYKPARTKSSPNWAKQTVRRGHCRKVPLTSVH